MNKINLQEKFALFSEHWTPKIIAETNGQYVKLAKGQGELIWHSHEHEDELFLVIQGKLTIQLRDGAIELGSGEMFIVPKGVEHCPRATEETHILLIEPKSTQHTGDVKHEMTVAVAAQEWL